MLFEEPGEVSNFTSNFYLVDGQEAQALIPEYLDYFFACNAMVPQEASSHQENYHSSTQDTEIKQEERTKEEAPRVLATEPTSETSSDQNIENLTAGIHESDSSHIKSTSEDILVKTSTREYSQNVLTDTSGNVLKLMYEASEEKHSLQLIHAIKCSNLKVIPVLPLILQCTITFGVGYAKSFETFKAAKHLSKKWLIIKAEETSVELPKAFSSHQTPFESDLSLLPKISTKDIVLLSHKTEEKAIPYAWYFLCHSIQNAFKETKSEVMSMDEVSDTAKKCHISIDELPEVLSYLHKSGFLLYYKDILPNVVFEDASLVIKVLNTAISNPHNEVATNSDSIIHESSFSQVHNVFVEDVFTFKDVTKLLHNLSIISLIDTQLFCMPTLLKEVLDEKHLTKHGDTPHLHVHYPVAPGVFEYLLCYLTSEQNEELWPWKIYTDRSKREPTCLYRNCAELTLPGYECIIILLQSSNCTKVYIDFAGSQPPLAKIGKSIMAGVKKANKSYYSNCKNIDVKFGFSCICGSDDFEHTMVFYSQNQHLECTYDSSKEPFSLSHNHKIWLEEGMDLYFFLLYYVYCT